LLLEVLAEARQGKGADGQGGSPHLMGGFLARSTRLFAKRRRKLEKALRIEPQQLLGELRVPTDLSFKIGSVEQSPWGRIGCRKASPTPIGLTSIPPNFPGFHGLCFQKALLLRA
ncbi:MAG: hypothetical protein JOY97_09770, partial [Hyphomicrobiales bacterium]|nr:hypothetical protein [Hyphomicrobiales bacterium]